MYKTFESTFGYEKYLSILQSKLRKIKIKFNFERKNHRLPVETCRWLGIHLNERCCIPFSCIFFSNLYCTYTHDSISTFVNISR